jgi:3-oxoacyl-[acyl-carrier-protein] synthase-3
MPVFELAMKAVSAAKEDAHGKDLEIGAVVAATFSAEDRFPALSVKIASAAGLKTDVPAFDIQMACSAYPYAVYTAGRLAADAGCKVLVVDGDVQSSFAKSANTIPVMSDASTATILSAGGETGKSRFAFYSQYGEALVCGDEIEIDGMKVFGFVASEVRRLIGEVLAAEKESVDAFAPHQANMYMVRQLAKGLGISDRLLTSGEKYGNVGSASVPLTLASSFSSGCALGGRQVLLAGFGAGLSAAAGFVRISGNFTADVTD